jgi:hypothetical protein
MKLSDLALKRKCLFWEIRDVKNLSENAIVERFLNYGTRGDFLEILEII